MTEPKRMSDLIDFTSTNGDLPKRSPRRLTTRNSVVMLSGVGQNGPLHGVTFRAPAEIDNPRYPHYSGSLMEAVHGGHYAYRDGTWVWVKRKWWTI